MRRLRCVEIVRKGLTLRALRWTETRLKSILHNAHSRNSKSMNVWLIVVEQEIFPANNTLLFNTYTLPWNKSEKVDGPVNARNWAFLRAPTPKTSVAQEEETEK